jgi:glycerol kinase
MSEYLLAIDQGTTSTRAIVFNQKGVPLWSAQQELPQAYPADGWVEHDPEQIWQHTRKVCNSVLKQGRLDATEIRGIGITNQRETTIVWDKKTGESIYPAIVWQDRRTSEYCQALKAAGHEELIASKTGLLLDPYFSASKIRWILDQVEGAQERAERGELQFGTVDSFLLWRLTAGKVHATDATNASRTLLFNIHQQCWDADLLALFNIPVIMLPEVKDCADDFGFSAPAFLGEPIQIAAIAGDQQAALVGQACFEPGMAKTTYGTGCFMVLNTGEQAIRSKNRLLTTVAYRLKGKTCYAVEGSIFIAGAAVQWLRDGLQLIPDASVTEALAQKSRQNHVYMVPAFTGLGAPYWDPDARGAILGLNRDTGIAEVVAAGLQSVCYQTLDLMNAMQADGADRHATMRVDGGMVVNNFVVQFLSDLLDATVERPDVTETTALGVAYLAGLQTGVFASLDDIATHWASERRFEPKMQDEERDALYRGWQDAVARVRSER